MGVRHFLNLPDLSTDELSLLIQRGIEIKSSLKQGELYQPFKGKVLAMIFAQASTRTRASFATGIAQLGGQAIYMSSEDMQLGRGESLEDTARVLSRMVDAVVIRTAWHEQIERFARYAEVPVINGLSDTCHPCQLLADMQTYYEHRGPVNGKIVAWLGDGNNMCHSYIDAARLYQFNLRFACPKDYQPDPEIVNNAGDWIEYCPEPQAAVQDADLIVTDVWASMGEEHEADARAEVFAAYQVNADLMALAQDDALFMHCLPAHRGDEVTAEVIDGPQSVVWDEAENRLHAQKALLEFLLSK